MLMCAHSTWSTHSVDVCQALIARGVRSVDVCSQHMEYSVLMCAHSTWSTHSVDVCQALIARGVLSVLLCVRYS